MATVTVTSDYVVYPGETLTFTDEHAFYLQQTATSGAPLPTFTIRGEVDVVVAPVADYVYSWATGVNGTIVAPVTIDTGGVLKVVNANARGDVTAVGTTGPGIVNRGTISVTATGRAEGISVSDPRYSIENSGHVIVTSTTADAVGVRMLNAGVLHNSGEIRAVGHGGALGVMGVWVTGFSGDLLNTGTIVAQDDDPSIKSIGVSWNTDFSPNSYGHSSFTNDGTIQGEISLNVNSYIAGDAPVITNNGTLIGDVQMGSDAARLTNTGLIVGNVTFGPNADVYNGQIGALNGGSLDGGGGSDSLVGGAAAETLSGGDGADTILAGGGDDVIDGGRDSDLLDGGAGVDALSYATATMGVSVDLGAGVANSSGTDTISGFEAVVGGTFSDTLQGAAASETLSGGAGDDRVDGGAGDDSLAGGSGQNFLTGGDGDDIIQGGSGFDRTNGNAGSDTVHGAAGDDWVTGGQNNDQLFGDDGADILNGNLGNDTGDGAAGNDVVRGGQGSDLLSGGDGDDYMTGDLGDDTLSGGAGADTFRAFAGGGHDVITDFEAAGGDRIQLDPGTTYTATQQGADVLVTFNGSGDLVLKNVHLSELPAGWILAA